MVGGGSSIKIKHSKNCGISGVCFLKRMLFVLFTQHKVLYSHNLHSALIKSYFAQKYLNLATEVRQWRKQTSPSQLVINLLHLPMIDAKSTS